MKICYKCNQTLPDSHFYVHPTTNRFRNVCKSCTIKRTTYTGKCTVAINTRKLRWYWDILQHIYTNINKTEFSYNDIKNIYPQYNRSLHMKFEESNAIKIIYTPKSHKHLMKLQLFVFTTAFIDYIENNPICSNQMKK